MNTSQKAMLGSLVVVITYLFWGGYVYILQNDLFFYHDWLDIPLHITGGLVIALTAGLWQLFGNQSVKRWRLYYRCVWWALFIGVIWEYYEYFFKLHEVNSNLLFDTMFDLFNDFIGGLIGIAIIYMINRLSRSHVKLNGDTII